MSLLTTPPYLKLKFFLFPLFALLKQYIIVVYILLYTTFTLKILLFLENNLQKQKSPSAKGQRAGN